MTTTVALRPITGTAFLARCRRRLSRDGETLHVSRSPRYGAGDLGELYVTDGNNVVTACHCTPESLERDLQVLMPGEALPAD
jgi:hypothetical protein